MVSMEWNMDRQIGMKRALIQTIGVIGYEMQQLFSRKMEIRSTVVEIFIFHL